MKEATYLKLLKKEPVTEQEAVEWMYDYVQARKGEEATQNFTELLRMYQGVRNFFQIFPEALNTSLEYYGKINLATILYGTKGEILHVKLNT